LELNLGPQNAAAEVFLVERWGQGGRREHPRKRSAQGTNIFCTEPGPSLSLALVGAPPDCFGNTASVIAERFLKHLIGSALLWGGNPEKDALYLPITPMRDDGKTVYKLTVSDVPVDGFWSLTVYNGEGYLQPNPDNVYSVNSITAKEGPDGSVTIQFGGCDGKVPNCLPITHGWNYTVRLFLPRREILDGTWRLPEAQPVS
jgi:hypothetical protein